MLKPGLLLFTFLYCFSLLGQEIPFYKSNFRSKNTEQAFVYDILSDSNRVNWFATSSGILRTTLNTDTLLARSAESDYTSFASALCSYNGKIIAGFFDGAISRVDHFNIEKPLFVASNQVKHLSVVGDLLYVSTPKEVIQINLKNYNSETIYTQENGEITDIASTISGVYIASRSGLIFLSGKEHNEVIKESVFDLSINQENEIWATTSLGIYKIQLKAATLVVTYKTPLRLQHAEDLIFFEENQRFYLSTNLGLTTIDKDGSINQVNGVLANLNTATYAIERLANTIWIGTYGEGIWHCSPVSTPVWIKDQELIATNGKKWAKYEGNKTLINGETSFFDSEINRFNISGLQQIAIKDNTTYGIKNNQLYLFSEKGTGAVTLPMKFQDVLAMEFIDNQTLAISERFKGVYYYNLANNSITDHFDTRNGLLHNDITQILKTPTGKIWFLSRASGISVLMPHGNFIYLTVGEGLPSNQNTALEFYKGDVWVSSEGGGLCVINPGFDINPIRVQPGNEAEYFYGLGSNKNGMLVYGRNQIYWLSDRGNQQVKIPTYSTSAIPFEGKATALDDGFLIPGYNGSLWVPNLLFKELNNLQLSAQVGSAKSSISGALESGARLATGKHEVQFQIEILGNKPSHQAKHYYKLEGYHNSWQSFSGDEISLSGIRYGDYALLVQVNGKEIEIFDFSIAPPLWLRTWFQVLILLVLFAIYLGLLRWRTYRLKQQNEALELVVSERTKDLAKRNKELQQFTFAISHDLKNPAANITELIAAFREDVPEAVDEVDFYLTQLDRASRKLYQNLLDLLEVLKQANAGELPKSEVPVAGLIEEIKDQLGRQIEKNQASFAIDLSCFKTLEYNKTNLQSILYNLISNAIKYRKPEVPPEIKIQGFETETHYGIRISDNGLGMDLSKNKETLFGLFKRFHDHVEGSGVGLYLVNDIVEKNGGFIQLESALEQGSTFSLHLVPKTT